MGGKLASGGDSAAVFAAAAVASHSHFPITVSPYTSVHAILFI